jgi:hypothetical protein
VSEGCGAGSADFSFGEPAAFSLGELSSLFMTASIKPSSRAKLF